MKTKKPDPLTAADDAHIAEASRVVPLRDNRQSIDSGRFTETLDVNTWATLDIPAEDRLLGDLLTSTARVFIAGRTGLGKTLLAQGVCAGMATGKGFCHWRADRPSRWLIIDGEMPSVLIKQRTIDLLRRAGSIPSGNLTIYSLDRSEEFARLFPGLGMLAPLNTEDGQKFVLRLADIIKPEGIAFDNMMSLVPGDQKDEAPWSGALPLVTELTKQKIAQLWLDHAGHNGDRQYGSSTKQWRMDAVGIMTALPVDQRRDPGEVAFNLSFEPPAGKARRRTPDNLQDFANAVIRLTDDRWTSEVMDSTSRAGKLSPACQRWHKALLNVLTWSATPGKTTRTEWFAEAVRRALVKPIHSTDTNAARDRKRARQRKFINEMQDKNLIGVDGETIIYLSADQ